jgi:GGDEF domain-containing protein
MRRIRHHVDQITQNRDRVLLNISMARTLAETTGCELIKLYTLRPVQDIVVVTLAVRNDGLECEFWSEDDAEQREFLLEDCPLLAASLERGRPVSRRDRLTGHYACAYPVMAGDAPIGFIEFIGATALRRSHHVQIRSYLMLYRNFLDLLDVAETDTLTGLLSRKSFDDNLHHILASTTPNDDAVQVGAESSLPRRRHPALGEDDWLAVLRLDREPEARAASDETLVTLAKLMRQSFRHYDKLFRFGAEEFVVLLRGVSEDKVHGVLERFRFRVEVHPLSLSIATTISIGYTRTVRGAPAAATLARAHAALDYASRHGGNQVHGHDQLAAIGLIDAVPGLAAVAS